MAMMSTSLSPSLSVWLLFLLTLTDPCVSWTTTANSHRHGHAVVTTTSQVRRSCPQHPPLTTTRRRLRLASSYQDAPPPPPAAAAAAATESFKKRRRMRASVSGVSLSPTGFHVVLELAKPPSSVSSSFSSSNSNSTTTTTSLLAIPVTDDCRDATQATSPQALTLLQLLATPGPVDMAGPVFPVETLSKLVVAVVRNQHDHDEQPQPLHHPVVDYLQSSIAKQLTSSSQWNINATKSSNIFQVLGEQSDWIQARISLPPCLLDEVQLYVNSNNTLSWKLLVRAPTAVTTTTTTSSAGSSALEILVPLDNDTLRHVCWRDEDDAQPWNTEVAAAFTCLALALRYKAPIVVVLAEELCGSNDGSSPFLDGNRLAQAFPLYKSHGELSQTTARVHHNIERGFQVHKLQAALQLAMQKGDAAAANKIRAKLDELDSMQDLPVQEGNDLDSMQ